MKYTDEELDEEVSSIDNPDLENPVSLDEQEETQEDNLSQEKEIAKELIKKEVSKKVISFILSKYKAIIIGVIVAIVIIFLIILVVIDFDFSGSGNKKVQEYPMTCNGINLTWENEDYVNKQKNAGTYEPITDPKLVDLNNTERFSYKNYTFDSYITNIVWNDNAKASDVKNDVVYQAMAIAVRSRIVSKLGNNCVVLRDNNPENFVELSGSEEKFSEISQAVKDSEGKMIGRNKTIIDAKYDTFSYIKKSRESVEDVGEYYLMNENEQGIQIIPATWVIEHNVPTKKVFDRTFLESLSLFGAKYLLEKVDTQYELIRILNYYYGDDIELYSIGTNNSGLNLSGCMWWPIGSDSTTIENGVIYAKDAPITTKITSQFGYRNQPTSGASTNHQAIDIGGGMENKTNIIAVADGVVTQVNKGCVKGNPSCGGGLGNYIKIKHNDGTITRYGHLYNANVNLGDNVKQGQVIGKMGTTGVSTGVHLDFQVIVNGTPVNPLNYVSTSNPRANCSMGGIAQGGDVAQSICLTFKNHGYPDNGIAGVMGNVQAESSFKTINTNHLGCDGIVQWCFGRITNLKTIYGNNWSTIEAQLEYLLNELNTGYTQVNSYLKGSASASEMAYYFCMKFEQPGEAYCSNGDRQKYANSWLNYIQNGCK